MNKSFLKILTVSILSFIFVMGCAALEDKEVEGPKPWVAESATKLDKDNKTTFNGNYFVKEFKPVPNNTIVGIDKFAGGFVLNFSDVIQYNYALKYGGYPNTLAETKLLNSNVTLNDDEYIVQEDGYTIKFTKPIIYNADGTTYEITAIKKSDDNIMVVNEGIDLNGFISNLTKLCDPTLPINTSDVKTCGESGAMNYIGYYRIETITCDGNVYNGGKDFAGEMTASADLTNLTVNNTVTVPITTKFQVFDNTLKNCIFTQDEISKSSLYFKQSDFIIDLSKTGGFNSSIFANVGLVAITNGDEKERTTYINYNPKDTTFNDLLFNGKKISMRLRIIQQRNLKDTIIINSPVTLDNSKYFQ